jgi:intracellular septation protein
MPTTALFRLLIDFGPVLVLFVAGRLVEFFTAITYFLIATFVAMCLSWIIERRIPLIPVGLGLFVILFGTATILLQQSDIIIFADTLYYSGGAMILGLSLWRNELILKRLFAGTFAISDEGWRILTKRWLVVFIVGALLNEGVRLSLSPEAWIDFKFYKVIFITLFGLYQFRLAREYRLPEVANAWGLRQRD